MIVTETYTKEWIDGFTKNKRNSNLNPELLEKMIYAFGLLEKLADAGLKFIFKGGTALVLLLNETYRFSIDIDIITTVEPSEIENILNELIQNQPFTRWEMDKRRSFIHQIPKAHYKLHWLSALN